MKRIIALLTLTCALSVSAFGGEIPTCSTVTADVPTVGTAGQIPGTTPTDPSTVPNEDEPSVLTTVLLTLVNLIGR